MIKNQRQAQKWSSRIREPQNQELARKRQTTNEKAKKKSTPHNFFNASSPP
jgi:hypothetical protein